MLLACARDAESFERIHRSNLIGMGVLPLQFKDGDTAQASAHRKGELRDHRPERWCARCHRRRDAHRRAIKFEARVRIDTPKEREYYQHAASCSTCYAARRGDQGGLRK